MSQQPSRLATGDLAFATHGGEAQLSLFPPSPEAIAPLFPATAGPCVIEREFWTARQRQAHSLHEVSYRACFKPQLPAYFIERLTQPGDIVYDPFSGRGTTAIEAALRGRIPYANDINPLSEILARPRIEPPRIEEVSERLAAISFDDSGDGAGDVELSPFYHPTTEKAIRALRRYLRLRRESAAEDTVDRWIRMVATNRLTGHSRGFFSVYTLPPNQATTSERQAEINRRLGQTPESRNVPDLILRKSRQLLKDLSGYERQVLSGVNAKALFLTGRAQDTAVIGEGTVSLVVTSPPFLDVVQYAEDNWLRCWFNAIDVEKVAASMSVSPNLEQWAVEMEDALRELYRVAKKGGHVAFEVGEVRNGKLLLDEIIAPLGEKVGFRWLGTLINRQRFTKTSNIWGVNNNRAGTNSNRIVVLRKDRT